MCRCLAQQWLGDFAGQFQRSHLHVGLASVHKGCLIVLRRTSVLVPVDCLCNAAGERHGVPRAPHPTKRAPVLRQGALQLAAGSPPLLDAASPAPAQLVVQGLARRPAILPTEVVKCRYTVMRPSGSVGETQVSVLQVETCQCLQSWVLVGSLPRQVLSCPCPRP